MIDELVRQIQKKNAPVVVGIDPTPDTGADSGEGN